MNNVTKLSDNVKQINFDLKLYTIYDKLAKISGPVFSSKNIDIAKRSVYNMFLHQNFENVNDYDLVELCGFDSELANIVLLDDNIHLSCAEICKNYREKEEV